MNRELLHRVRDSLERAYLTLPLKSPVKNECLESIEIIDTAIAKLPPVEVWCDGKPSRMGVYRVERIGVNSKVRGYSYWNGTRWGMIFSSRKSALCVVTRKTPSKYPMRWLRPTPKIRKD